MNLMIYIVLSVNCRRKAAKTVRRYALGTRDGHTVKTETQEPAKPVRQYALGTRDGHKMKTETQELCRLA